MTQVVSNYMQPTTSIENLPSDVFFEIFKWLDIEALHACSRVNHLFRTVLIDRFWSNRELKKKRRELLTLRSHRLRTNCIRRLVEQLVAISSFGNPTQLRIETPAGRALWITVTYGFRPGRQKKFNTVVLENPVTNDNLFPHSSCTINEFADGYHIESNNIDSQVVYGLKNEVIDPMIKSYVNRTKNDRFMQYYFVITIVSAVIFSMFLDYIKMF